MSEIILLVALVLAVAIMVVLIIASGKPNTFSVRRSISINCAR